MDVDRNRAGCLGFVYEEITQQQFEISRFFMMNQAGFSFFPARHSRFTKGHIVV